MIGRLGSIVGTLAWRDGDMSGFMQGVLS